MLGVGTELVVTSSTMSGNVAWVSVRIVHHFTQGAASDLACVTFAPHPALAFGNDYGTSG